MNQLRLSGIVLILLVFCAFINCATQPAPPSIPTPTPTLEYEVTVKLPEPRYDSDVSIEQSLLQRRSTRSYTGEPITLQEVSQLLWAAQGITDVKGYRTAPSAGALYPLEVYVIAGDVEDLAPGIYKYDPNENELRLIVEGDKRSELAHTVLSQSFVNEGALAIVISAVYERTTIKYGNRGIRYVHIEVGHAAQSLCLQAAAMDLGAVTVGAFNDEQAAKLLDMPEGEHPLYIIPVGRK